MSNRRKLLYLIAIAIVVGTSGGIFFALESYFEAYRAGADVRFSDFGIALPAILFGIPISFIAGTLLAAAVPSLLSRLGLRGPIIYMTTGMLFGGLVYGLVWIAIGAPPHLAFFRVTGILAGAVAGLSWWLAVQRHEEEANTYA